MRRYEVSIRLWIEKPNIDFIVPHISSQFNQITFRINSLLYHGGSGCTMEESPNWGFFWGYI